MAIKFQYNKTSLQQLEKQLKVRERALPTIKSKESALRLEVKRTKDEVARLELQLEEEMQSYDSMVALWNEFDPALIRVRDVSLSTRKIAGVVVPVLSEIQFEIGRYSLFGSPAWFADGIELLKKLARTGIEAEFSGMKLELLEHARKKRLCGRTKRSVKQKKRRSRYDSGDGKVCLYGVPQRIRRFFVDIA